MSSDIPRKGQTDESSPIYLQVLRILALPLAVLILSNLIFESVAFDIDELIRELRTLLGQDHSSGRSFMEARARLFWGTPVFIFYATFIGVTIFNIRMIRKSINIKRQIIFASVIVLIAVLNLGYYIYSGRVRNNFSNIFYFTFDVLAASNHYTGTQLDSIRTLVSGINVLPAFVPPVVLMTGCFVLIQDRKEGIPDLKFLELQMHTFKLIISSGTMLMTAGVLHMIAWLHWPAVLVYGDPVSQHVVSFSETLGLYWGASISMLIAVYYVPAALQIQHQATLIVTGQPELIHGMEPHEWLKKHGLSVAPMQQIPQIAVMLAPMLAGPVGSALTNLSSTFIAR